MQRLQAVKIKLSNGQSGIFWGNVLVEDPSQQDDEENPVTVTEITFEPPKFVGGVEAPVKPA